MKQEGGRYVVRREILASPLFRQYLEQYLEIAPEEHPLFIGVEKGQHARRRGSMRAKELCFFRATVRPCDGERGEGAGPAKVAYRGSVNLRPL